MRVSRSNSKGCGFPHERIPMVLQNPSREGLIGPSRIHNGQQAAGWTVMKLEKPLPDGNVAYVRVIH